MHSTRIHERQSFYCVYCSMMEVPDRPNMCAMILWGGVVELAETQKKGKREEGINGYTYGGES